MRSLLALALFLFVAASVDGLELGSRLLDYVEREFGKAARGRLENWKGLVAEHRSRLSQSSLKRSTGFQ